LLNVVQPYKAFGNGPQSVKVLPSAARIQGSAGLLAASLRYDSMGGPKSSAPVLNGLYEQLLRRGVQYFLPSSRLEIRTRGIHAGNRLSPGAANRLRFELLGIGYALTNPREFSDHEQRMVRRPSNSLLRGTSFLFDSDTAARDMPIFGGLTEDRYVSTSRGAGFR
jgi:hypothetical protein